MVDRLRPRECPIFRGTDASLVFTYTAPPAGEIGFRRAAGESYYREVWQFTGSNHFVSCHAMKVATQYDGAYMDATYRDETGIAAAFARIIALPAEKSDNAARVARVRQFADAHFQPKLGLRLLDVGAGLGVFPHAMQRAGWVCTAIDPDPRAVHHLRERVGVEAICGDFMNLEGLGQFDVATFNKVLEHVVDPVAMLRRARAVLAPGGFVYMELPDGEMAARAGSAREEFFIEHLHVFSFTSTAMLATRAGFAPVWVERLQEPSSKFTLRAFLVPDR